ncbi:hypothetical protein V1509DRAFT_633210 [Lipomyces kononenkoae]
MVVVVAVVAAAALCRRRLVLQAPAWARLGGDDGGGDDGESVCVLAAARAGSARAGARATVLPTWLVRRRPWPRQGQGLTVGWIARTVEAAEAVTTHQGSRIWRCHHQRILGGEGAAATLGLVETVAGCDSGNPEGLWTAAQAETAQSQAQTEPEIPIDSVSPAAAGVAAASLGDDGDDGGDGGYVDGGATAAARSCRDRSAESTLRQSSCCVRLSSATAAGPLGARETEQENSEVDQ